jgi:hypothetical protein
MVKQKTIKRTWCDRNREYEERKSKIISSSAEDYQKQIAMLVKELKI